MMKLGISMLTNVIYLGKTRKTKQGYEVWSGDKTDVTEECIQFTVEHLIKKLETEGQDYIELRLGERPYVFRLEKESEHELD